MLLSRGCTELKRHLVVEREGMDLITESGKTSLVLESNTDHLGGEGRGESSYSPSSLYSSLSAS